MVMRKILKWSLIGSCVIFSVAACRTPKLPATPDMAKLPAAFVTDSLPADTVSSGQTGWQQFYTDELLVKLISEVLENHPDQQLALQQVEIMHQQVLQRRAAFLPTFDGVLSGSYDRYGKYTLNGVGNFDTNLSPNIDKEQRIPDPTPDLFIGIRSRWEIDLWGRMKSEKKAALSRLLAAEKGRRFVSTQLVAHTASLYYELVSLDRELEILLKNIRLQQQALDMVRIQKSAGRATELAVLQFEAQLVRTKSMEFITRRQVSAIENELNFLCGRYEGAIVRSGKVLALAPEIVETGVPAKVINSRPDVQEAEWLLEASKADVIAVKKAFLPALTIMPYAGLNSFNISKWFSLESAALGIVGGLTAPVLNRRILKTNFGIASAQQRSAFETYRKTLLNAFFEINTGISNWRNQQSQYEMKQKEFLVLEAALRTANDLYASGYASYLEVITAQKGVLDAELEQVRTRLQMLQTKVALYRSLGGG
jgi:NodT family efflux transporter outer membrane factor (OMF) lipoprotein